MSQMSKKYMSVLTTKFKLIIGIALESLDMISVSEPVGLAREHEKVDGMSF